jgi:chaperonin GroES
MTSGIALHAISFPARGRFSRLTWKSTADESCREPINEGQTMTEETSTTVRPLHDRILVKRLDSDDKTPGGIYIPENAKEKPLEGVVVAVGTGTRTKDGELIPLDVKQGDRVLFAKYSGTEIKVQLAGGEHLILREDDVLAVLD